MEKKSSAERIKILIDFLQVSSSVFAKNVDVSPTAVKGYTEGSWGKEGIKQAMANRITDVYPHISEQWIKTGEGSMLVPGMEDYIPAPRRVAMVIDAVSNSIEQFALEMNIPVRDLKAITVSNAMPSKEVLDKIQSKYKQISVEWLREGRGEMMPEVNDIERRLLEITNMVQDVLTDYKRKKPHNGAS